MPEKPYAQPIPYRDKMPIMKEWRRLNAAGKLEGAPSLFFQPTKPPEEFYDIVADPYEINNLIDSPKHQDVIGKMRGQLQEWITSTGDLGDVPEDELIERMWPGKKQPVTAPPTVKTSIAKNATVTATITCSTNGASIGYRLNNNGRWRLYTKPINLKTGDVLKVKAIRIGYSTESREELMARIADHITTLPK